MCESVHMQALTEEDDSLGCAFVFIVKAEKTGSCHAHFLSCEEPVRFRGERHAETNPIFISLERSIWCANQ